MSEFKPIETQEDFDNMVKDRIARAQKSVEEKYKDYESLKQKTTDYEKQLADFKAEKSTLEKEKATLQGDVDKANLTNLKYRVAIAEGIPISLADRLQGETEEEIKKDAKNFGTYKHEAPLGGSGEPTHTEDESAMAGFVKSWHN